MYTKKGQHDNPLIEHLLKSKKEVIKISKTWYTVLKLRTVIHFSPLANYVSTHGNHDTITKLPVITETAADKSQSIDAHGHVYTGQSVAQTFSQ